MSILLTDEKIVEIVKGFVYISKGAPPQWWRHEYPKFARAQLKKDVEWLVKHNKGYHRGNYGGEAGHFVIFRSEVEALKKEAGIE